MVNVASLQLWFWVVGGAQISMCAKSHPIWNSVSEICIEYPSAPHWKYHIVNDNEKLSHTGQASSYWNKIFQKIISKYISQRSQQVILYYLIFDKQYKDGFEICSMWYIYHQKIVMILLIPGHRAMTWGKGKIIFNYALTCVNMMDHVSIACAY